MGRLFFFVFLKTLCFLTNSSILNSDYFFVLIQKKDKKMKMICKNCILSEKKTLCTFIDCEDRTVKPNKQCKDRKNFKLRKTPVV